MEWKMGLLFLTFVTASLSPLFTEVRDDDSSQSLHRPEQRALSGDSRMAIRGYLAGALIAKGMTREQVGLLLGGKRVEFGFSSGSLLICYWTYYEYGVTISFQRDKNDVLRVSGIDSPRPFPFLLAP
jgi:hypothetical protein